MLPDRYPAESRPIELGLVNSAIKDRDEEYWNVESQQLSRLIEQQSEAPVAHGDVHHFSILALAPQPLLVTMLGYLLSDIPQRRSTSFTASRRTGSGRTIPKVLYTRSSRLPIRPGFLLWFSSQRNDKRRTHPRRHSGSENLESDCSKSE